MNNIGYFIFGVLIGIFIMLVLSTFFTENIMMFLYDEFLDEDEKIDVWADDDFDS